MLKIASLLSAAAAVLCADQVVLKNGDIITGSIVKKDGGKLTLRSEFLGEISMPWTAVKSVKSDETLTVHLTGGDIVAGKVTTIDGRLVVEGKYWPTLEYVA